MPAPRLSLLAPSVAATQAVAGAIAGASVAGDIIVLAGEMGAGKTAFAQGFGHALGVNEPITSPTFTLVHSYATTGRGGRRLTLHHADLYRLEQLAEVADLAFGELAEFDGIVLVEWGDVVAGVLGDHLEVRLDVIDDDDAGGDVDVEGDADLIVPTRRCITVTAGGKSWAHRWSGVALALGTLGLSPC